MTKFAKRFLLIAVVALALVLPLVFAAGAHAYPGFNSWSESQVGPGQTLRFVYGSCQVMLYQIPVNITSTGYIHVEMEYGWPDYDCYIYLIDQFGNECATTDGVSTDPQGYMGSWRGKEAIDFYVQNITPEGSVPNDTDTDLVGDTYYVMVQAFDDVSSFELHGYYPRIDYVPGHTNDPYSGYWIRGKFNYPAEGRVRIYGAPYGTALDFTPTSEGRAYINTRYPFDPKKKTPLPEYTDPNLMLCAFDQYLYPGNWSEDGAYWDMAVWGYQGHWGQTQAHGGPPPIVMAPDPSWTRRISAAFDVMSSTTKPPGKLLHYIPVLWMVSSDATAGSGAPPKSGMSTVGYLGSILYPQNLYLNRNAVALVGAKVRLTGNLALAPSWSDPSGQASEAIGWAPAGARVDIQGMIGEGGAWRKVGSGQVSGDSGRWTASVPALKGKAKYRAFWMGTALKSITVRYRAKYETSSGSGVWQFSDWKTAPCRGVDQALFTDGSFDILVSSLDATNGIGFRSLGSTVGGAAWNATLKQGDPTLTVTFDDKPNQPVEIAFVSTDLFSEFSLASSWITK